jgi:hypothetical protein
MCSARLADIIFLFDQEEIVELGTKNDASW